MPTMPTSTPSSAPSCSSSVRVLGRQDSYTHSFPTHGASVPGSIAPSTPHTGLSLETKALAKKALRGGEEIESTVVTDRTMLFFGGLQWLLDSTIEAQPVRRISNVSKTLTEDAVRQIGSIDEVADEGKGQEELDAEAQRTAAWISDQMAET